MGDESFEPHSKRRDTSWVQGELATDFPGLRNGVDRIVVDSRYHLTTPTDFSKVVEQSVVSQRGYRASRFGSETFAFAFRSSVAHRYGLNSVGVVYDELGDKLYNVVVYEDGTTEVFDPEADPLVVTGSTKSDHEAYGIERGFIVL